MVRTQAGKLDRLGLTPYCDVNPVGSWTTYPNFSAAQFPHL